MKSALKGSTSLNNHQKVVPVATKSIHLPSAILKECQCEEALLRAALCERGMPTHKFDAGQFRADAAPNGDGLIVEWDA